ncbi:hypothetical protein AXF42_Ash019471 [Apostasia shenzhenica]|uniref:Uncharacterized protein n=1 Tax=Apostasia shenzhenica TaxID=1088818 RepID=A0A2I0AYG2_9ASPA|nr:hypothetical protein AXF42_Ash019471 [Apostasia shenzhenica]
MVARIRRTNSAARSAQTGEPSVRAPGNGASASTSRHRTKSASSSKGTHASEIQEMLANLTNLVTGLTAQQAMILRQTQPVCAAMLPPSPGMVAPATLPPAVAALVPPPAVAEAPAPLPLVTAPSA